MNMKIFLAVLLFVFSLNLHAKAFLSNDTQAEADSNTHLTLPTNREV